MDEEKIYLKTVLTAIDEKVKNVETEKIQLEKDINDIGIPDKEDASILRKTKGKLYDTTGKIQRLKGLKKTPHFGRMDLRLIENDSSESLTMYIGEKAIDDSHMKPLVYDWRSPVANLYYMANQTDFKYNDSSYDLLLKRQIDIENSKLINCYDTFIQGEKTNVTDLFLQKILKYKKDRNEFVDIIKTIQASQNCIIRDDPYRSQIVQGVAGSGKTVVLLHRLSYLLYNYPNIKPESYIYITPSKEFSSKLFTINRSLSLHEIKMCTMEDYYLEKIHYLIPSLKVKQIIKDDFKNKALVEVYSQDFSNIIEKYTNAYFKDYIEEIKSLNLDITNNYYISLNNIIKSIKRKLDYEEYETLEEKQNLENVLEKTRKYLKSDTIKKIADNIYNYLANKYNLKKTYVTTKLEKYIAYIILTVYQKIGYQSYRKYSVIFIDEMQDYSQNEIKSLNDLENKPCINLYGDINQNILWYIKKKDKNDLLETIRKLNEREINYYELNENYRNTKQVANYVNNFVETKMIPMGIDANEVIEINTSFDEFVNSLDKFSKETVFITNNQNALIKIKEHGFECYTVLIAKGMEFSKVVVINNDLNNIEKYIAYTRTLDQLTIYNLS